LKKTLKVNHTNYKRNQNGMMKKKYPEAMLNQIKKSNDHNQNQI